MKLKTRGAAKTLSLALDSSTSTWPPKGRGRDAADDAGRPRTATLDKPVVLDIALLGHLDMSSLTRRGLLNVCRKGVVGVLGASLGAIPSPRPPRRTSRASSRSDASSDEQQATPVAGRRPRGGGALVRQKKAVIEEDYEDESSWAEDEQRFGTYRVRRNNRLNRTFRVPTLKKRAPLNNIVLNNVDAAEPAVVDLRGGRRRGLGLGLEDILAAREQVPEPCRTCGRPELPERLHSHPKQPSKPATAGGKAYLPLPQPRPPPDLPIRNAVKKPVAIKYRPRRGSDGTGDTTPATTVRARSPALRAASRRASPTKASPAKGAFLVTHFLDAADGPVSPSRAARGPRIVACFVCGREFGTASLPLHEPQCIQRWQLQNSKLPLQWQRHLPEKPVGPITVEDWNKFAWDSSKRADSVQCPNCLRRFCPDRINSHERVCFKKQPAIGGEPQSQADSIGSMGARGGRSSPLVECYLCGKKFGTRSIGIHEPQCLKKWQQLHGEDAGNAGKALDKPRDCPQLEGPSECKPLAIEFPSKAPAPTPGPAPAPAGKTARPRVTQPPEQPKIKSAWVGEDGAVLAEAAAAKPGKAPPPAAGPAGTAANRKTAPLKANVRGRPLRCYLCGQMFGLQSLSIHEPQCLQKWRLENAKLPANLQRPEPQKPEIVFTDTGAVDCDATADAAWQAHLSQLIPCSHCGRKFSPDRIGVHERCCKGSER